jgi:uncharacterized membrane protein YgcG
MKSTINGEKSEMICGRVNLLFSKGLLCLAVLLAPFNSFAQATEKVPHQISADSNAAYSRSDFRPDWSPSRHLSSETGTLTLQEFDVISGRLSELNKTARKPVGVIVVGSTFSEPINEFGDRVASDWNQSSSTFKPGVVFVLAKNDRKFSIRTSIDASKFITNEIAQSFVDEMTPKFRDGAYADGLLLGINRYGDLLSKIEAQEKAAADVAAIENAKKEAAKVAEEKAISDRAAAEAEMIESQKRTKYLVFAAAGAAALSVIAAVAWFIFRRSKGRRVPEVQQMPPAPEIKSQNVSVQEIVNSPVEAILASTQEPSEPTTSSSGTDWKKIQLYAVVSISVLTTPFILYGPVKKLLQPFGKVETPSRLSCSTDGNYKSWEDGDLVFDLNASPSVLTMRASGAVFFGKSEIEHDSRTFISQAMSAPGKGLKNGYFGSFMLKAVKKSGTDRYEVEMYVDNNQTRTKANPNLLTEAAPEVKRSANTPAFRPPSAEENAENLIQQVGNRGGICSGIANIMKSEKNYALQTGRWDNFQETLGKAKERGCF